MQERSMNIPKALAGSGTCLGTITSGWKSDPLTDKAIRVALAKPLWPDGDQRTICDIIKPGESVCFVVSDHTRKTACNAVLPVVLKRLADSGCRLADMFILVASGIHRPTTPAEMIHILGKKVAHEFEGRIFQHDPDDDKNLAFVGTTTRGHRVRVNRRAIDANRIVLLGAATYHYHAGFGGGRKSLVPGLAGRDTISCNHSLTLDPDNDCIHPNVGTGVLDGNPVAEEMLEAAHMCRPDITINTVLTPDGKLAGVFSGELDKAHRAACNLVEQVNRVDIQAAADIVVASAETAGNWIQSHKALYNAHRALCPGGRVLLLAPCPEGLGNERFRYWIKKDSLSQIYAELRQSAEVLGQTALSTKSLAPNTILVTDMSRTDIVDLGIETATDLENGVKKAVAQVACDGKPTYYLMPQARYTVPFGPMVNG